MVIKTPIITITAKSSGIEKPLLLFFTTLFPFKFYFFNSLINKYPPTLLIINIVSLKPKKKQTLKDLNYLLKSIFYFLNNCNTKSLSFDTI